MPFNFLTNTPLGSNVGPGVPSGFENLLGYQDPSGMGLLGAAGAALSAGGRSREPVSLGQAIGNGLMGFAQAQNQARRTNALNAVSNVQLSELLRQQTQRAQLGDAIKKGFEDPNSDLNKTLPSGLKSLIANADPQTALSLINQATTTKQGQDFSRETLALQQGFQKEQSDATRAFQTAENAVQRAHSAFLQDRSAANAATLQQAQQAFAAAQADVQRAFQSAQAQATRDAPLQPVPDPADPTKMVPRAQAEAGAVSTGAFPEKLALANAAAAAKPLTDEQAKAAGFADRMRNAEMVIADPIVAKAGQDLSEKGRAAVPLVGNMLVSNEYQKFDQAQRDFVNAVLRRESGAVISDSEFDNARKQYFPQPGDSKEVLAQKAQSRTNALKAMERSAGTKYEATPAAPPTPAPAVSVSKPMANGWRIERVQ